MLDPRQRKRLSKFLSYSLRHHPEATGLVLAEDGSAALEDLVSAARRELGIEVTREDIVSLTDQPESGGKRRFELLGDRIRAGHGHSIPVEGHRAVTPMGRLFHATTRSALPAIREKGLCSMSRQRVHLTYDPHIAVEAARRQDSEPILIEVKVAEALLVGVRFYESADLRIILSDDIPPGCLRIG